MGSACLCWDHRTTQKVTAVTIGKTILMLNCIIIFELS